METILLARQLGRTDEVASLPGRVRGERGKIANSRRGTRQASRGALRDRISLARGRAVLEKKGLEAQNHAAEVRIRREGC